MPSRACGLHPPEWLSTENEFAKTNRQGYEGLAIRLAKRGDDPLMRIGLAIVLLVAAIPFGWSLESWS
jgi:hypothetical protein